MTLIQIVKAAKTVLIICHTKPDGDCLGSGLALRRVVEKLGKPVDFVTDSDKPAHYSFMKDYDRLNDCRYGNYDLVIAVDCADELRMGKYAKVFRRAAVSVNIDHHPTNNNYGKINFTDHTASSTCELLYGLIAGETEIDRDIASWLYVGLSTDTGNFIHSNSTPKAFRTAAALVEMGADLPYIAKKLYKSNTVSRTRLVGKAIGTLRLYENNTVAVITVTAAVLAETGCTLNDTEGMIDHAANIECVEVAVCMSEQAPNSYKVSFRSKGQDVSKVARSFGGGGHVLAAGCVVNGFYEDVIEKVLRAIRDER